MFDGYIYTFGNAHGTDVTFTVNINLNTGNKIYINELFYNNFKEKITHKFVKGIDVDIPQSMDIETQASINQEYNNCINDFDNSYNNFTFGNEKLIIILHIRTDYVFYIELDDLKDCIKKENPLWTDII